MKCVGFSEKKLRRENKQPVIFINQKGKQFEKNVIRGQEGIEFNPVSLAVCDFNNDGDVEFLFANQPEHLIFLLRHKEGIEFEWLNPKDFRMPDTSRWVCWGDLNNDGYDELLSVPEGIYLNHQGQSFEKINLLILTHIPETEISDARIQCFDADNDGKQDIMLGYRIKGTNPSGYGDWWYLNLFKNNSSVGNWIELEFQGHKGNPEGFATKVLWKIDDKHQKLRIVGETEHSRAHQGNYRLHFGLGSLQYPPSIFILTPDGQRTLDNLKLNIFNKLNIIY